MAAAKTTIPVREIANPLAMVWLLWPRARSSRAAEVTSSVDQEAEGRRGTGELGVAAGGEREASGHELVGRRTCAAAVWGSGRSWVSGAYRAETILAGASSGPAP